MATNPIALFAVGVGLVLTVTPFAFPRLRRDLAIAFLGLGLVLVAFGAWSLLPDRPPLAEPDLARTQTLPDADRAQTLPDPAQPEPLDFIPEDLTVLSNGDLRLAAETLAGRLEALERGYAADLAATRGLPAEQATQARLDADAALGRIFYQEYEPLVARLYTELRRRAPLAEAPPLVTNHPDPFFVVSTGRSALVSLAQALR